MFKHVQPDMNPRGPRGHGVVSPAPGVVGHDRSAQGGQVEVGVAMDIEVDAVTAE
jgi:hypothetical protein